MTELNAYAKTDTDGTILGNTEIRIIREYDQLCGYKFSLAFVQFINNKAVAAITLPTAKMYVWMNKDKFSSFMLELLQSFGKQIIDKKTSDEVGIFRI